MLNDKNLTSNVFENMQAIKGETIKGVIAIQGTDSDDWLIVFETGYSLQIHPKIGAFWINNKAKTKQLISSEVSRRSALIENLEEVQKLL